MRVDRIADKFDFISMGYRQMVGVHASVICATHFQKRFAVTGFAALLCCLCKCLG